MSHNKLVQLDQQKIETDEKSSCNEFSEAEPIKNLGFGKGQGADKDNEVKFRVMLPPPPPNPPGHPDVALPPTGLRTTPATNLSQRAGRLHLPVPLLIFAHLLQHTNILFLAG